MATFGDILKKAKEQGGFELLAEGVYVAKVIETEARSSSTSKPQIKLRFEVVSGPHAGFKGLWTYLTLTTDNEKALGIFYSQLSNLGITAEYLETLGAVDPDTAMKHIAGALDGKVASIKVKIDTEYNNNKVDRINKAPADFAAGVPAAGGGVPFAAPSAPAAPPSTPF